MASVFKRLVVGRPLASSEEGDQRISKPVGLAVFASDAISSTAYATEEILLVLLMAVTFPQTHTYLVPIALAASLLLLVVLVSYRQTIAAYPNGGGAYVVSKENISQGAGLVAGASLLVDYTLTVAVSVSSGVLAIASAVPSLRPESTRIALCLGFVTLMTMANLRGLKEAGKVFAVPTYLYVVLLGSLLVIGLTRVFAFDLGPIETGPELAGEFAREHALTSSAAIFVLLRAFSSGAVVLSGIEAISNGVPTFRPPESKNANTTLTFMGLILGGGFLGISVLANHLRPVVDEGGETVLSQMGKAVFGETPIYYGFQIATFAILIPAANTAYAGFPQLSSIIAKDGYLPRQLATRGDRLAFSNGIIFLAAMAGVLIVIFRAEVSALIPLYAVGVFTGFSLSQAGMIRHHLRLREPHWQRKLAVNAVGCFATTVVLLVVVVSKFTRGAWIPAVVIPLIVLVFRAIHKHYASMDRALAVPVGYKARRRTHTVVVLVGRVTKGSMEAIAYARSLRPDRLLAVSVVATPEQQERITADWEAYDIPVELRTLYSPFRELSRPILRFVDEYDEEVDDDFLTVVLPEFVLDHWYQQLLHNQSALILRTRLRTRPNTVVTSVPFHLRGGDVKVGAPLD
ncbi:MAG: APC family permease [Iamia sp.]